MLAPPFSDMPTSRKPRLKGKACRRAHAESPDKLSDGAHRYRADFPGRKYFWLLIDINV